MDEHKIENGKLKDIGNQKCPSKYKISQSAYCTSCLDVGLAYLLRLCLIFLESPDLSRRQSYLHAVDDLPDTSPKLDRKKSIEVSIRRLSHRVRD